MLHQHDLMGFCLLRSFACKGKLNLKDTVDFTALGYFNMCRILELLWSTAMKDVSGIVS